MSDAADPDVTAASEPVSGRVTEDSAGSQIARLPRTLADLPFFAAGRFPRADFIGRCHAGGVSYMSGRELVDQVRDLSLGLSGLGLERGDRVALLSESRPEWLIADFAVLAAGGVTTPIYTTLSAEQVGFILRDSGASIAIVSSRSQLDKVLAVQTSLPSLRSVVLMDEGPSRTDHASPLQLLSLSDVTRAGHRQILNGWGIAREFHDRAQAVSPDDLATIIYTSGTTGEPKGVMLTHRNIVANLEGALAALDLSDSDVALSFLPLCHAFERLVAYVYFCTGIPMIFAESIETIARDLATVRPTVMSGVPRVFEKLHAGIHEKGRSAVGVRRRVFEWAASLADRAGKEVANGRPWTASKGLAWKLAYRLVYSHIHAGLGGRVRYAVSGSAPLDPAVARFFFGLNLPILEGYGLTETSPVVSVMPLYDVRLGTVGPPLPNVELKLAEDGELLVRGPSVMSGYYRRPDDTAAVLSGGWFRTGDIGHLDERGYIRITDRKKEILVTSGGKKVAPQPIELKLRADPLVSEAIVVGDRRHFPAALLVPDWSAVASQMRMTVEDVLADPRAPELCALFGAVVDRVNQQLAQFERIKRFELLVDELTIVNGALTPTLKIKRRVVEERYRAVIDGLYDESRKR
jgi:long-chain acyl-CoA synthetase